MPASLRWVAILALLWGCAATGDPRDAATEPDAPPSNRETCGDGLDTDRDGTVDEGCDCSPGQEQRCFRGDPDLAGIGACIYGTQRCTSDFELDSRWDACEGDGFPGTDLCNSVDDDCDGEIDEGCSCVSGEMRPCYDGPAGTEGVGLCRGGTETCFGDGEVSMWDGCAGAVRPRDERCDNGEDDDCDGSIDEGCACDLGTRQPCFGGPPGSRGVGACRVGEQTCVMGASGSEWSPCVGEVAPRTESCSGGVDEDCDGVADCADPECTIFCCEGWSESVPIVPAEGEILFIVDRSGSMDWPAVGTTRTRWQELSDAVDGVLPMLSSLPMGMLTFPQLTGDDERGNCMVASSPDVGISLGSGSAIMSRLVTVDPRAGDTPTPQAFATAESYLTSTSSSRERFIILATDGLPEPACGSTLPATVTAIGGVRSRLGVDTFVIGIVGPDRSGDTSGIPALRDGLNMMADAGGRPRTTGTLRYYEAVDGASLTSALRSVIAAATDCEFTLSSTPPRPGSIEVRMGSTLVPATSWTLSGRNLSITGFYCDQIRAGLVTSISVADPC
jgi:hypothetical protein